jgi:hypothetical protein
VGDVVFDGGVVCNVVWSSIASRVSELQIHPRCWVVDEVAGTNLQLATVPSASAAALREEDISRMSINMFRLDSPEWMSTSLWCRPGSLSDLLLRDPDLL